MAGDGRPRHCGRRADEAWPDGPYAYLPRGGIAITASPGAGGPSRQAARPVIPLTARTMAEQVRCSVTARSRPGARRCRARPRSGDTADRGDPAGGEGRPPAGRDLLPGKRPTCRVCYTPPASAATARGDVAAGRRGRIADLTTLMLPADLAAVSSLPLVGQRAAPADFALRGRWRVRRSRAARNSRFWCLSFAGLLLHRSRCLRCSGPLADSCPRQGEILSLAVSCCCRQSQRGGSRAPVSEPAWLGEPARAVAGLSGQPDSAHGASEASPAGEPFRLVEPPLV